VRSSKEKILSLYFQLSKNTQKLLQLIIERGFEKIGEGSYKSVYSKKELSYVIKLANSLNDEFAEVPSKLKKFYVQPYYCDNQITIQQKANTKKQELNYNKILNELGYKTCQHLDVIPQNCGSIKDKPVVFDFAQI